METAIIWFTIILLVVVIVPAAVTCLLALAIMMRDFWQELKT